MKFRLLFGLFFIGRLIYAQDDFRPGYIVKLNNDTVYGTIDYTGDRKMGELCRFKGKDYSESYFANEISEYRFVDGKYFISKHLDDRTVFMEYLLKGKINIYYLRDDKGDHYFLQKVGDKVVEVPYEEGLRYNNNKEYWYESKEHIGILSYYMQDAPELLNVISSMKEPTHDNLIKLAEDYHNMVCKDSSCIIYTKKKEPFQLNLDIVGGLINYPGVQNIHIPGFGINNRFQGGVLAHLRMPRISENLYFKSGLLFSTFSMGDEKMTIYKIPIQLEYKYPKGIIRPKLAIGINLYKPLYHSLALSGGVDVKLSKTFKWVIYYDLDFNPSDYFAVIVDSVLSQSILSGFAIKI